MRDDRPQILIIGAGPGGLAAAILLAGAGLRVKLIEKMSRPGGRTSSIQAEGFRFDVGPTFFLYPRVLEEIYKSVGRDLKAEVPMERLDPQYRLVFGSGGELLATPNVERMEQGIEKLCPQDAKCFRRFLDENRAKLERFRPALESPFLSWRDTLSPSMMKMLPFLRPHLSLDGELGRYFSDPRLRLAMSFQSKYLGMSPFRCPSLFSILAFLEYEYGVWHPIGGCGAVSENMAKVARELGVEVHLNESVQQILFDGKKAVGVQTDRAEYACDGLVINADFARAMEKLVPNRLRNRWTDAKLKQKKYSCSTFMMYLGIEGRYDNVSHHTIYMAKDYRQNLIDIEQRHVLSEDPSVYVQNASVTDPTLAPRGMSTLYVLVPVTHQHPNVDWTKERARYREVALRQLRNIGIEDVEKRIRFERVVTPNEWDREFEIYRGATFNLTHNLGQMLHLRPRNRFEDLKGVYLVGGGTHPGSGLPVIYESARITSKLMLNDFGVKPEWRHSGQSAGTISQVA
ncbi:MAG: phytoene desaturase family protein [Bryobacteraceae bacterium]|nr:phytoene desaturase family protein [Bryobacteraceae bacterium]